MMKVLEVKRGIYYYIIYDLKKCNLDVKENCEMQEN